jgi:hypothetical protein
LLEKEQERFKAMQQQEPGDRQFESFRALALSGGVDTDALRQVPVAGRLVPVAAFFLKAKD